MQIIRRSEFVTTSWKNGGGVTHEALRMPPEGDPFLWRVSIADVGSSGPFSDFTGYRRAMVLLRGSGVRLHFADGTAPELREVGDLIQFDGAMETHCEILAGACTDLNLILSRTVAANDVRVERLLAPTSVKPMAENLLLVFPVCGQVTLEVDGAGSAVLDQWDLAHVPPGAANLIRLNPVDHRLDTRVFMASFRGL
jgi:environmental stress-induced protein Ves